MVGVGIRPLEQMALEGESVEKAGSWTSVDGSRKESGNRRRFSRKGGRTEKRPKTLRNEERNTVQNRRWFCTANGSRNRVRQLAMAT